MELGSTPLTDQIQIHPTSKPASVRSKKRNDVQKYDREQLRIGLRKGILREIKSTALDGIRKIKGTGEYDVRAKLHSIILSTDKEQPKTHTFNAVKDFLGELWFDPNFRPEDRGRNYGGMLVKQLPNFQINVLIDPVKGVLPLMMVEVHPRGDISLDTHKTFLLQLSKALPGLKASSVEYPTDIYCSRDADRLDVANYYDRDADSLFWVVRQSLLIPYQRITKFYADEYCSEEFAKTGKRTNFSIQWGSHKVYERGEDKNKKRGGWDYDDVDRVRLEHTAGSKELRKYKIITLENVIREPKFHEINKDIWNFKRFKQTKWSKKKFPQEWEDYPAMDDNKDDEGRGYPGSFQAQYNALGRPRAYVEPVPELIPLKESLIKAMKVFDDRWRTLLL